MKHSTLIGGVLLCYLAHLIAPMTVDLTIERIEFSNKTPNAVLDFKDMALKKFNRTHKTVSGHLTFLKDIDNDYEVGVEIYKMQGNEYRKTPFKYPYEKVCDFLSKETYFYPSILASSNLPPQETCPLPAGTYTLENYFIDVSKVPPNFEGRFRLRLMERHLGELIDELNGYGEIRNYIS